MSTLNYELGYADGESSAAADLNLFLYDALDLPDPAYNVTDFDTIRGLVERIAMLEKEVYQGKALLTRYRDEVPLGHQPHMIAHVVDRYLEAGK